MRQLHKVAFIFLPVLLLALGGCGGSSGSGADPFARTPVGDPATSQVTAQDPTFSLTLTTDLKKSTDISVLPQIDVNNGTVLLTAGLTNVSNGVYVDPQTKQPIAAGAPVPNQTVLFKVIAPVPVFPDPPDKYGKIDYSTQFTDKNGVATAILTMGDVPYTTNVIVEASVTFAGNIYRAYTGFQIVRGTGVIMFTSAAGLNPGSQVNILGEVKKDVETPVGTPWHLLQLIPFKLTDSNGNPRVKVPVTISVYSITGVPTGDPSDVTIDFIVDQATKANQQTIITDSAGQGVFNVSTLMLTPPPGTTLSKDVVFKAVTDDAIPVTAYVGDTFTLTSKTATTLSLTATPTSFGAASDLFAVISGGTGPFTASSSDLGRVTAAVQANGVTVLAHLVDTSDWSGPVVIVVTDSAGKTAAVSVTRK